MSADTTEAPRSFERWAWPGGYEIFAVMDDGGTLCVPCCNDPSNPVRMDDGARDGWGIVGFDNISNCDEPETCDHCSREIN